MYVSAMRSSEKEKIAQRAASALKVNVGKSGVTIGEEAVQLHGGMGTTDELAVISTLFRVRWG